MQTGLTGENEIKVFILYLMNQVNHGLCYDDIAGMTYESGCVGYFDFADVFSKLVGSGDVYGLEGPGGQTVYNITGRGAAIAENLAHLIPAAFKTKGAAVAVRCSDLKKSGAAYSCAVEEEAGGYRLRCAITSKEENSGILDISLFVKDKATAEKISGNFNKNPGAVYRGIYAMLTGDADFLF